MTIDQERAFHIRLSRELYLPRASEQSRDKSRDMRRCQEIPMSDRLRRSYLKRASLAILLPTESNNKSRARPWLLICSCNFVTSIRCPRMTSHARGYYCILLTDCSTLILHGRWSARRA